MYVHMHISYIHIHISTYTLMHIMYGYIRAFINYTNLLAKYHFGGVGAAAVAPVHVVDIALTLQVHSYHYLEIQYNTTMFDHS